MYDRQKENIESFSFLLLNHHVSIKTENRIAAKLLQFVTDKIFK